MAFLRLTEFNALPYIISRDGPRLAPMTPVTAVYSMLNSQNRQLLSQKMVTNRTASRSVPKLTLSNPGAGFSLNE